MHLLLRTILLCLFLLGPVAVQAHDSGLSFEGKVGRYLLDVGYDVPLRVGVETLLDAQLFLADGRASADFAHVDLLIEEADSAEQVLRIESPEFGKAIAVYTPRSAGSGSLTATFHRKSGEEITTHFLLHIERSSRRTPKADGDVAIFAILAFCLLTVFLWALR